MVKRITSQDVADLAGVSRTTVSFVLNNVQRFNISTETRKKVLEAAEVLGYVPLASAQALASNTARAIGLVMTRSPQYISSDAFMPQIIAGMLDIVKEQKLGLLIELVEPGEQRQTYLKLIRAKHIDGMILLTPRNDDEGLVELQELNIPAVVMGRLISATGLSSVDIDNRAAARTAVEHLIGLGHRQIGCILNAPVPYSSAYERLAGYQDALAQYGITPDQNWIKSADFDPMSGYTQMKLLLEEANRPTAVFIASDNVAIGAMLAMRDNGVRVPEDISIVGFDDIPSARFFAPPLTTIRTPARELAQKSCFLLLDLISGRVKPPVHLTVETELIIRQSSQRLFNG
ncbi:MAG TPA: LacI family DNA-binding transcriptional regulator [Anaerolineaceae bacterium]|nr:LacI family DNA-binding transcriptional regulator [Anaerolineaceae bacterium]